MVKIRSLNELKPGDKIKVVGYSYRFDNTAQCTVIDSQHGYGLVTKGMGGLILSEIINYPYVTIYKINTGKTHLPPWW